MLADARSRIARYAPAEASRADAVLVDLRSQDERERSLAAAVLVQLGVDAGDVEGGFAAWSNAGLPVVPAPEPASGLPGMGGPQ